VLIMLEIRSFIKKVTVAVQTTHDLALQFALAFSRIGIQGLANAARMALNDNVPLAQFTFGEWHSGVLAGAVRRLISPISLGTNLHRKSTY
jgi:hypothetical protein